MITRREFLGIAGMVLFYRGGKLLRDRTAPDRA